MDSSRLETVLVDDVWSSLSNGLKKKKKKQNKRDLNKHVKIKDAKARRGVGCRFKYLQVTSKFSFTVPRSLISTASVWGSGQNRSSISQDTLPTTT